VRGYQQIHGLGPADGIVGSQTIASLNRGAQYYARKIAVNMERAHRLPKQGRFGRYVLVDSGPPKSIWPTATASSTGCA
jgi:L,D-transpeptidase YcbB